MALAELVPAPQTDTVTNHESPRQKPRLAVIGAGIIGLTTAVMAQQQGYDVIIYSPESPFETTSSKAGASFKPHKVEVTDTQTLLSMLKESWNYYEGLLGVMGSGIKKYRHYEASDSPIDRAEKPYLDFFETVTEVTYHNHSDDVPGGYNYAFSYDTFHIDTIQHINFLFDSFIANGGNFQLHEKFTSFNQLDTLSEQVIMNCTGLGSQQLLEDGDIIPVRGQILKAAPIPTMMKPGQEYSISVREGGYIYHGMDMDGRPIAKLGGIAQENEYDTTPRPEDTRRILEGNERVLDKNEVRLTEDDVRADVGLRPYRRTGIRIDTLQLSDGKVLINDVGHGGGGYTLGPSSVIRALGLIPQEYRPA